MSVDVSLSLLDSKQLSALNSAALRLSSQRSLNDVVETIPELIRNMVSTRFAAIVLPGRDGKIVHCQTNSDDNCREYAQYLQSDPHIRELFREKVTAILNIPDGDGEQHTLVDSSLLCIPVLSSDVAIAYMFVSTDGGDAAMGENEQAQLQVFAEHASTAIQNALLFERSTQQAVLEERERIGMDLHDGIIQSIYAVGLSLELSRVVLGDDHTEAGSHLSEAVDGLDNIIRDIRSYIMDLQPGRIRNEPLAVALDRLIREFRANTLVNVQVDVAPDIDEGADDPCCLALFHITQEALANVAKHARASSVNISLGRLGDRIILDVTDDGAGFDSQEIGGIPGHGLSNMAVRAQTLGGDLTVTSSPGEGTHVVAVVPVQASVSLPPALVPFP
ncbi:MAG: GAF domain-containing sensor histidine kinase [Chloroflexota bacterium]